MLVCAAIYTIIATVALGATPFTRFANSPEPLALILREISQPGAAHFLAVTAVLTLPTVILAFFYGQSRIFFVMARDGLLPKAFAVVHPKFRTPWIGTILLGIVIAIAASFLPISILGDLVSLGTATAFAIVCLSVIVLRIKHPDMERPFRVPGGMVTAVLGILACLTLASFNFVPMVQHALNDNPLPLTILGVYAVVGALIYGLYGFAHSKLAKGIDITEDVKLESAADAFGHGVDNKKDD